MGIDKKYLELKTAMKIAEEIAHQLEPICINKRCCIAGSVRRRKPEVGDIEFVVVPKVYAVEDLFGNVQQQGTPLDRLIYQLGFVYENGRRKKKIALDVGLNLEIYIVLPPAQWGVIYTIRTGPAEFSKWCVTQRQKGGLLPSYARVEGGAVKEGDKLIEMPEEIDFLNYLGLGWVEPSERVARWPR